MAALQVASAGRITALLSEQESRPVRSSAELQKSRAHRINRASTRSVLLSRQQPQQRSSMHVSASATATAAPSQSVSERMAELKAEGRHALSLPPLRSTHSRRHRSRMLTPLPRFQTCFTVQQLNARVSRGSRNHCCWPVHVVRMHFPRNMGLSVNLGARQRILRALHAAWPPSPKP